MAGWLTCFRRSDADKMDDMIHGRLLAIFIASFYRQRTRRAVQPEEEFKP
jgi:hypothetical protein